ncbi:MAG: ECF-type sigma factor [bacterium]|nr:ECF-type sigma factor [bacterium]
MTDDFDQLLGPLGAGERASPQLMERLYVELRAMAERLMQRERGSHTLQPTALVHEAFLRLVNAEKVGEKGHLHFLDAAAVTMRRVLVDHARKAGAQKRGGGRWDRVTLRGIAEDEPDEEAFDEVDIAALDAALAELGQLDERHAKIVELRFFGGMSGEQIAEHLEISRSTVVRDLAFSRAWLQRRMKQTPP